MLLGRVIGTVWATRKEERLADMRLMIVQAVNLKLEPLSQVVVAVDVVSAGVGELVLVTQGSSARQTKQTQNKPVDAVISAIVDDFSYEEITHLMAALEKRQKPLQARIDAVAET